MAITIPVTGYCVIADVEAKLQHPKDLTSSTTPTEAQAEAWITEVFDEINAMLSRAGYHVPMTITRAQYNSTGTLVSSVAQLAGDQEFTLTATTLTGSITRGTTLTFDGDSQVYTVIETAEIGDGDLVDLAIVPPLRKAVAASATVTITQRLIAAEILKGLNSDKVAGLCESTLTMAGGDGENANATVLMERFKEKMESIEGGRLTLVGALRDHQRSPIGHVRLEQRG